MNQLLLVEDDELVGDGLRLLLKQAGFSVEWVRDGRSAVATLSDGDFDSVVLDLNLPGGSGMSVLQWMRDNAFIAPVVIVTARDATKDRVEAFNCGADDYVVKPINIDELVARLRAVQRRVKGRADEVLRCGELVLNPIAHVVMYHGQPVEVSKREFAVLQLLMDAPGNVVTRQQLEDSLYSVDTQVSSNAIEVYIHNLRKKLSSSVIRTVRGVGYKIESGMPQ